MPAFQPRDLRDLQRQAESLTVRLFAAELLSRFKIQNAKIFATVRNVATWSKEWEYGDPETGDIAPRTYSLGINLTF